jgi:2-oxoglutarate ferredoxin oxidoreductase subunit beta
MTFVDTSKPPQVPARKTASFSPGLLQTQTHHLCAGCGHPLAVRMILEVIEELQLHRRTVAVFGHGCSGTFNVSVDIDVTIALHGRAPACATGIKRMRPDVAVFTMQGDGDMVSEGLADMLHTAARGERLTCFLLNNGVFGDTGGQMTSASVIGLRTKTSLEGRDAAYHGHPIVIADIISAFPGVSYVARASVHKPAAILQARHYIRRAFENQLHGAGLAFVEILTMCPTGWAVPTPMGPQYMMESLGAAYPLGEMKRLASPQSAQHAP